MMENDEVWKNRVEVPPRREMKDAKDKLRRP